SRLASNSLLEAMVLARRLAVAIRTGSPPAATSVPVVPPRRSAEVCPPSQPDPDAVATLRRAMWDHAGPVRDADGLTAALGLLATLAPRLVADPDGRNLATIAEVVLRAALARTESRGAHHRRDHPDPDPLQARPTLVDLARGTRVGPRLVVAALEQRTPVHEQVTP
ncbi:MAG: L-aspartate oxidase, partial [Nitriliruptoraceae bacterium]